MAADRRRSSRVRVTPQLIRVSDDRHLWAGRYDETIEEVFQVQSRIAEQVATELDMALQEPEHEALAAKPTDDLRAYDFYLRGNDFFDRPDPEASRAAEEMYTRATELDPAFALAFARLARTYIAQFHLSERTPRRLALARSAADSALRLQPGLSEAHLALGQIHYWGELNYEAALGIPDRHAADPGNGDLAWARALVERRLGQWDEAIAICDGRWSWTRDRASRVSTCSRCISGDGSTPRRRAIPHRALELEPQSPVYVYKALLIVTRDGDLDAAAGAIKEGIRRAGPRGQAMDSRVDLGAAVWSELDSPHEGAVDRIGIERFGADSSAYYLGKARIRRYAATRGSPRVLRLGGGGAGRKEPCPARRPRASRRAGLGLCRPGPSRARHPGSPARGRAAPAIEGHVAGGGHGPQSGGGVRRAG